MIQIVLNDANQESTVVEKLEALGVGEIVQQHGGGKIVFSERREFPAVPTDCETPTTL